MNRALQRQASEVSQLIAENRRLSNVVARADASLPDKQMNELLRLRGEVGLLRQQAAEAAKKQAENRRLQAALAQTEQQSRDQRQTSRSDQERLVAAAKLSDAKLLVMGALLYAEEHQDQAPPSLDQIPPLLPTNGPTPTGTNQFDLVYQGVWSAITNPVSTIVLREKQAWQALDGSWGRTYGFADGHSELHTALDGDFVPWETQHMLARPSNQ